MASEPTTNAGANGAVPGREPLSARLRAATRAAHERAETSTFMTNLVEGRLDAHAYLRLLEQYQAMYDALEEVADELRAAGEFPELLSVDLERRQAIASDLAALRARLALPAHPALAPSLDYAAQIRASARDAVRFLAHHYVRYLGDLSGGQAMRVWLVRHYGLAENETAFFRFDSIPKAVPFKKSYRAALDALALSRDREDALLTEAVESFHSNERIFAALHELTQARLAVRSAA